MKRWQHSLLQTSAPVPLLKQNTIIEVIATAEKSGNRSGFAAYSFPLRTARRKRWIEYKLCWVSHCHLMHNLLIGAPHLLMYEALDV